MDRDKPKMQQRSSGGWIVRKVGTEHKTNRNEQALEGPLGARDEKNLG